jgi:hypothetical protein
MNNKVLIPATRWSKERILTPKTAIFQKLPNGTMYNKYTDRSMSVEMFYEIYCGAAAFDGVSVKVIKLKL